MMREPLVLGIETSCDETGIGIVRGRTLLSNTIASSMDELQEFYDAAFPRLDDAASYLEGFPLDALPEDASRLLRLTYSLINISFPVEAWRQPRVPDSGASTLECIVEPAI